VSQPGIRRTSLQAPRKIWNKETKILKYHKKFKKSRYIWQEIWPGNWQYWSNLRALQPASLFWSVHVKGDRNCALFLHSRLTGGTESLSAVTLFWPVNIFIFFGL
jgi:hypothetical protein